MQEVKIISSEDIGNTLEVINNKIEVKINIDEINGLDLKPSDGDVLVYNETSELWESKAPEWIKDSPKDGSPYVRLDGVWVKLEDQIQAV